MASWAVLFRAVFGDAELPAWALILRSKFEFIPGPIFNNFVLADEINRAPPRTQSALLEAMSDAQVSVDGCSHPLAEPFMVIATQNPYEFEGTYVLPESQMDRFLIVVQSVFVLLQTIKGVPPVEVYRGVPRVPLDRLPEIRDRLVEGVHRGQGERRRQGRRSRKRWQRQER